MIFVVRGLFTMLFMSKRNSMGPKIGPCGTPTTVSHAVDKGAFIDVIRRRLLNWREAQEQDLLPSSIQAFEAGYVSPSRRLS